MQLLFLFILVGCSNISAQSLGGKTLTGDYYVCVPDGYCNTNGEQTNPGIDPRIVTPSSNVCPNGLLACYTQGPGSRCGIRYVEQTSTSDGTADPGAYPWQAYLQNSTHQFAGSGVLIDNYHVLTAAHKIDSEVPGKIVVFMGVHNAEDLTTDVQNRTVETVRIIDGYDKETLFNDLAILRVSHPFSLSQNNINTACLPPSGGESTFRGQECVVSGWGQTSFEINDAPTNTKKQVFLKIVSNEDCRKSFSNASLLGTNVDKYFDTAGEICAGGELLRDACSQDGGSPLVCPNEANKYITAGLVIWGKNCGQPGVYGVYVHVPSYRSWIDSTLEALNTVTR